MALYDSQVGVFFFLCVSGFEWQGSVGRKPIINQLAITRGRVGQKYTMRSFYRRRRSRQEHAMTRVGLGKKITVCFPSLNVYRACR
jgi:hypothetical protein